MITQTYNIKAVNVEALNDELKSALPGVCDGFTWVDGALTLYLYDNATKANWNTAEGIIKAHDPSKQSDAQRKAQLTKLEIDARLMEIGDSKIDETKFKDPVLIDLAKRVALLEMLVRQMQGINLAMGSMMGLVQVQMDASAAGASGQAAIDNRQ